MKNKQWFTTKTGINYIKRRHRAFLWMFPLQTNLDITTNKRTTLYFKRVFGHTYILGDSTEELLNVKWGVDLAYKNKKRIKEKKQCG